jgi:pimeloyl-ACP methyl ester carboxylesterase
MPQKNVIFLHGFASSGMGTKGQYLRRRFQELPDVEFRAFEFTPTPKDFEYMTITGMINRLRQFVLDMNMETFQLIGSSFGALVGMNYAGRFGGVEKPLLLAPALSFSSMTASAAELEKWREQGTSPVLHYAFDKPLPLRYEIDIDGRFYVEPPSPTGPVTIIHGASDEVVPVERSRQYASDYPDLVKLIEVDAGHDLNDHLDDIWEQVEEG